MKILMLFRMILLVLGLSIAPAAPLDEATRGLARDIFRQLIEINTTESAGNTTVAARAMEKRLLDAGFPGKDVTVLGPNKRKGNLVARLHGPAAGTLKPILIIGHLDVVEALRKDWTTNPFQFVEKDGYFYGRGTQDMKVDDAIVVTTLIRYQKEGYRPNRDLIVALTADEEGGQFNGVDWLLKHHRDLIDAEFVLNADSGGVNTEKGKLVDIEVAAAEKLYADFEITATNPGGHSSLPVPDNAIYRLANALVRLEHSPFPVELNGVTRGYFERLELYKNPQTAADMRAILKTPPDGTAAARLSVDAHYNAQLHTTCVATRLNGGHADNALPQTAQALINCRILPGHSAEEVRQDLVRKFADPGLTVRYMDTARGQALERAPDEKAIRPVPPRQDVLGPLEKLASSFWPGAPVIAHMESGASDSKYTVQAGLPSYGFSGIAIDRDDVRAHGRDERVPVTSFYTGLDFYYRYLKALTGTQAQ